VILSGTFSPHIIRLDLETALLSHCAKKNNIGLEETPNTFQLDNAYLGLRMHRWQGRIEAHKPNMAVPSLFIFKSILEVMLQTKYEIRQQKLYWVRELLPELDRRFAGISLEMVFSALRYRFTHSIASADSYLCMQESIQAPEAIGETL